MANVAAGPSQVQPEELPSQLAEVRPGLPTSEGVMPPLPGAARQPTRPVADVPFSGIQQMLLVVEAVVTPQGLAGNAFERALAHHGVAIEGTVPVDADLEASLLASRFFDPTPAERVEGVADQGKLVLVYVNTRGEHVDQMWRAMQANPSDFSSVRLDMAFLAEDLSMFRDLRRAVEQQSVVAPGLARSPDQMRRAAAHRLALAPNWRGSPVTKLQGSDELTGLVPDWMLGHEPGKRPSMEERLAGPPPPKMTVPPDGQLGADLDAEVLFVIHAAPSAGE
jgi:hypothetical protein